MTSRRAIGWCLFIAGLSLLVWQAVLAVTSFREWWRWRIVDPSGAELYEINIWLHSVCAAIAAVFGWLGRRLAK